LKNLTHRKSKPLKIIIALCLVLTTSSCVTRSHKDIDYNNICEIFDSKKRWYKHAKRSTAKWGGNIQLAMAIIYQESSFNRKARPKRSKIFGIIPGPRPSNAYGYPQALKSTWAEYKTSVRKKRAKRTRFKDAFDFVQWYINNSSQRNNVSKWDYKNQYLNYHEGHGGYARGTYANKTWLINAAKSVEARSKRYAEQLKSCQSRLR